LNESLIVGHKSRIEPQ